MNRPRVLILGYGNPDRQDDGVGYQALLQVAERLGRNNLDDPYEALIPQGLNPDLWFDLQLKPEMAEDLSRYDQIFFIDAHTGSVPEEIGWRELQGEFQTSPLTHHLTPESCLSLTETLYGKKPDAVLISIRGYEFGFTDELSQPTRALLSQVIDRIMGWLNDRGICEFPS